MNTIRFTRFLLALGLAVAILLFQQATGSAGMTLAAPYQDAASQAESLIQQAREQGLSYLQSKNENAKKVAKKNLEQAEKLLKDELKRSASCEKCTENLVATLFYQTYFGFAKNYEECAKTAEQGLTRFPANSRIAFFKGYAHYNSQEYSEAIKAFNRYLTSASNDPQIAGQVRQLLQDSQQRFLTNWNRQANYYQSKESRIERLNPQTFKNEVVFQVTPEWELNLGSQGFAALTTNAPRLEDPEIQTYLENLVARLVSKNPGPNFNYKVTVINSPDVNAVTPPGHIIVYTGLLAFADSESQLAGVLAHELGHNYAHHQARAMIKGQLVQGVANSITQMINPQGGAGQIATQLGANVGLGLFQRAYSRFEEKEADLYGAHIIFNAGYDPTALSAFFTQMYKANPKQPVKFLSTHPPMPDRATYLIDYLDNFPLQAAEVRTDSQEFQRIKSRVAATMPGAQQNVPGKGVLPPKF